MAEDVFIAIRTMEYQMHIILEEVSGGLGIEENIVTLCPDCHREYDDGNKQDEIGCYIRDYLKWIYGQNWSEEKLYYNKRK